MGEALNLGSLFGIRLKAVLDLVHDIYFSGSNRGQAYRADCL